MPFREKWDMIKQSFPDGKGWYQGQNVFEERGQI